MKILKDRELIREAMRSLIVRKSEAQMLDLYKELVFPYRSVGITLLVAGLIAFAAYVFK